VVEDDVEEDAAEDNASDSEGAGEDASVGDGNFKFVVFVVDIKYVVIVSVSIYI
jgi:hypothetical protein